MGLSLSSIGNFSKTLSKGLANPVGAYNDIKNKLSGGSGGGGDTLGYDVGDLLKRLLASQQTTAGMVQNLPFTGATSADLAAVLKPLQEQMAALDGGNPLAGLTSEVVKSSLGSTAGASMAAVNAARLSGDGRFGSGGAAAILAGRAATDAAVGGSAAIANALVQGRVSEANYQQGIQQQKSGLATTLAQVLQGQADFKEGRARFGIEQQNINQNAFTQFGQIAGGIKQAKTGAKAQKDSAWIGGISQILAG